MKIFHLSHIDLDGFGCQYLVDSLLIEEHNIEYKNTNYGQIIDSLEEWNGSITKDSLLIITDLNLNRKEAEYLENKRIEVGFDLQLLDHHGTGLELSKDYDWYYLDTTKCGTLLTYEWLTDSGYNVPSYQDTMLAYLTNIYDLWKLKDKDFQTSVMFEGLFSEVMRTFPLNMVDSYRDLIFNILDNASLTIYLNREVEDYSFLEDNIKTQIRSFMQEELNNYEFKPFDVIKGEFLAKKLLSNQDYIKLRFEGSLGLGVFNLSRSFQEISQYIMREENVDFVVSISDKGTISVRGNNDTNVRIDRMCVSQFNGGGHKKAGGGIILKGFNKTINKKEAFNALLTKLK